MSKNYDLEFKLSAIKLAKEAKRQGISISQTSRNLGVSKSMLHKWIKASAQRSVIANAFPGKGHLPAAEEEIRQLRKELAIARQERDILKKQWPSFPINLGEILFYESALLRSKH